MSVLAMPLQLGHQGQGRIEDAEALVRKVVDDRLHQWGARLKDLDRDDLVSYLIGVCWELSCRYDPAKDRNPNFAAYAARILTLRVADWYRQRFGDTRHGDKPIVLSLDAPITLEGAAGAAEAEGADRLVDTLASSTGDPALDRDPDLVGLLNRGGGGPGRAHDPLGEPAPGGAPGRARGPANARTVKPRVPASFRAPGKPPVCSSCVTTFRTVFGKVNAKLDPDKQLSDEQLDAKAAKRAQAVRFGSKSGQAQWACPRCTKLEDEQGKQLMLQQAYPSRQARRDAIRSTRKKGRPSKAPTRARLTPPTRQERQERKDDHGRRDT